MDPEAIVECFLCRGLVLSIFRHAVQFADGNGSLRLRVESMVEAARFEEVAIRILNSQHSVPGTLHHILVFATTMGMPRSLERQQRHGGGGAAILHAATVAVRS